MRPPRPHTPGPWRANGREIVTGAAGNLVATALEPPDARRIAGAVNACEGIPTRELEGGILADLFFQCGQLKSSRIQSIMDKIQPKKKQLVGAAAK